MNAATITVRAQDGAEVTIRPHKTPSLLEVMLALTDIRPKAEPKAPETEPWRPQANTRRKP